jgi:hypothetical protein
VRLLLAVLAAAAASARPEVHAVRLTTIDYRPALRVLTSENMAPETITREDGEIVVRIPGVAPEDLTLPAVETPIEGLRVEREEAATVLHVKVPVEVPYSASREPGMLTLLFGEPPSPLNRGPVTPELYKLLFPPPAVAEAAGGGKEESRPEGGPEGGPEGLSVGRLLLRPYATLSWVDADILAFDSPVPTRTRYLQVAPGLTGTMPLFTGRFAAEYEPRLRFFSDIPEIGTTSHFAGARFEVPVGTRTLVRVAHRYTRAVLETDVVDPGREYFFNLARFTFNQTTVTARIDAGPSLSVDLGASWAWTRFDRADAGFFDHDSRTFRAGLGYDLRSDLRATVSYEYDRIPPAPDRPVVESSAHNVLTALQGQITPLTSGSLTVGFRHQANPEAPGASGTYTGVTVGGALRRELGFRSALGLALRRSTEPSGFEENAYYVTNQVTASLDVPAPFALWARGSVGFLRNDYPTPDPMTGEPRRDDIWAWTAGMGRQLGWRTWIRADYRRETRRSNVPGYDVTTDGFVVQVGIGLFTRGMTH